MCLLAYHLDPFREGPPMPVPPGWQPELFRPLLLLQARQLRLDPRLQRRFDASDLVQETLLRAHQQRAAFRGTTDAELMRWLQEILANLAIDQLRRETAGKRDLTMEHALQTAAADSSARLERWLANSQSTPDARAQRHKVLLRLAAALEQLPEDQRDVVTMRDLQEMPVAQIAAALGRTEKSVAGLLLRGRRRLRELLPDGP
jgi:RNA polymerase sigma-70 factor (ECF subfamily)